MITLRTLVKVGNKMQINGKNKIYWIIGAAIMLAAAGYAWQLQKQMDNTVNSKQLTEHEQALRTAQNNNAGSATNAGQNKPRASVPQMPVAKTYTEIIKIYEGRRIQFDEYCTAIPNNVTYKSKTQIMLDNRSNDQRKITVDGVAYSVAPFGYKIITLPSAGATNKTIKVNCADLVNVATILIQQ